MTASKKQQRTKSARAEPGERPSLRERIENNLVTALVGFAATVAGATYGVVNYIEDSRHEAEVAQLERELQNLKLGLVGEYVIDLKSRLLTDRTVAPADPEAQPFEEGRFYAARPHPPWVFETTTEAVVRDSLVGRPAPTAVHDREKLNPAIYLWKVSEPVAVEGHAFYRSLYPFVFVQPIDPARHAETQLKTWEDVREIMPQAQYDDLVKQISDGSDVGRLIIERLHWQIEFSRTTRNTNVHVEKIEKLDNVVYCELRTTIYDVTVNNRRHKRYFINEQYFFVSSLNIVLFVRVVLPSDTVQSPEHRNEVKKWLSHLYVYT